MADKVQGFPNGVGAVVFPFTFIMLVDWLRVQQKSTLVARFYERPRTARDWISGPSIVAFALGFVISTWGQSFLPGLFYNVLPLPVVSALVAAILLYGPGFLRESPYTSAPSRPNPSHAVSRCDSFLTTLSMKT